MEASDSAGQFELIDYTRSVVEHPERYFAADLVTPGSLFQKMVITLLRHAYWLCPTYLWLLRKPAASGRA